MGKGEEDCMPLDWENEIERFLGNQQFGGKIPRHEKEATLDNLARYKLESFEHNDKVFTDSDLTDTDSYDVPRHQADSGRSFSRYALLCVGLCISSLLLLKHGYCQGKSWKLCWNNNIQDFIYPVLRGVRLMSLPLVQYFPSITDVHEETCLLENPLYWDADVDCTLCRDVGVVTLPHAAEFEELFYHKGVPVVVQDAIDTPVTWSALTRLYAQHRSDIKAGSGRLQPAWSRVSSLEELMATDEAELADLSHCIQWRILRVAAVRHIRDLFTRPYFVSKKTEVSLHRYIYICGIQADRIVLPVTEFANVWVSQHSGSRQIQLKPSRECSGICRTVSALLRPGETLFFNWRYWRATSVPVSGPLPDETASSLATFERQPAPPTAGADGGGSAGPAAGGASPARLGSCRRLELARPASRRGAGPTCPAPTGVGVGVVAGDLDTDRATEPSRKPTAVGITFVGSFY